MVLVFTKGFKLSLAKVQGINFGIDYCEDLACCTIARDVHEYHAKIHIDNPNDTYSKKLVSMLSILGWKQHVNIPTHEDKHTLDLIISRDQLLQ